MKQILQRQSSQAYYGFVLRFLFIFFVSKNAIVLYLLRLLMGIMNLHWFAAGSVEVALFCLYGCHRLTCEPSCFAFSSLGLLPRAFFKQRMAVVALWYGQTRNNETSFVAEKPKFRFCLDNEQSSVLKMGI